MIADIIGTESQHSNQKNGEGNEAGAQELSPDLPPKAVDSASKPRRPRGFAAMDRKLVSEIARKGGKAAHSAGTAHEFTTEEARVAGRKGGQATHAKRRKDAEPVEGTPSEPKTEG